MNYDLTSQINQNPAGAAALTVLRELHQAGHEAWLVGGGVRDLLLGRDPKDFDIATEVRPEALVSIFPGSNMVGARFGVFIVRRNNHHVEVATFREEGEYQDRRRPDMVRFSTLENDARRRDFTVNALYYNPASGELRDLSGGVEDIRGRTLRTVGNPEQRFREDSLRVLRGLRFAANLGFEIEPSTWSAIKIAAPQLQQLSAERIRDELLGGLSGGNAGRFLQLLDDSGALEMVVPEVSLLNGCAQPPEFHPEGDVFAHTKLLLEHMPAGVSPELAMAVLLHDIAKPATQTFEDRIRFNGHDKLGAVMAEEITRRLRFSNSQIEKVSSMIRRHMQFINLPNMRKAKLKRFLSEPTIDDELELHRLDCLASHGDLSTYHMARQNLSEFREEEARGAAMPTPLITGRDLIDAGMQPGPNFSRILTAVYDEQLDGTITDKSEAVGRAVELWKEHSAIGTDNLPNTSSH